MPIIRIFSFLGDIDQENIFYDILERRNTFLGYKKRGSKSRKIDIFLWNLSNEIGLTMDIFQLFFFGNIDQENVPYDILQRENAFLGYKKKEVQKSPKIDIFSKGLIHGFGQKMDIFPTFFLGNIDQENVFYDILEG